MNFTAHDTAGAQQQNSARNKLVHVISASAIGTLIEFYDLILAIALAPILSRHFFPETEARLLETLAIAITSYFVRPIGALLFGKMGDTAGRKKPLLISFFLMGAATFLIGCLPGFASIGRLAPVFLLVLKLLQGLPLAANTLQLPFLSRSMWTMTSVDSTRVLFNRPYL